MWNLSRSGIELASPALAGGSLTTEPPGVCVLSHVRLLETPQTVAQLVPLSLGFSRQKYWSRLSCLCPGYLTDPGIELVSPASLALADKFFTTEPPGKRGIW